MLLKYIKVTLALSKVMECSKSNLQQCDVGDHAEPFSSFLFCPPLIQNNGAVETMDQALLSLWQCHLKG